MLSNPQFKDANTQGYNARKVSYDQNISLVLCLKDESHVGLRHPSCVYIPAQRQYTAGQKMRTPLK